MIVARISYRMTIFDCDQGEFNCLFTVGDDVVVVG
jgi:hypothetical protein